MYTSAHRAICSSCKRRRTSTRRRRSASSRLISMTNDLTCERVVFPFVLPNTQRFVDSLAAQYHAGCGERLVVTSGARPVDKQPRNASPMSVHPTGMAVDFRKPTGAGLSGVAAEVARRARAGRRDRGDGGEASAALPRGGAPLRDSRASHIPAWPARRSARVAARQGGTQRRRRNWRRTATRREEIGSTRTSPAQAGSEPLRARARHIPPHRTVTLEGIHAKDDFPCLPRSRSSRRWPRSSRPAEPKDPTTAVAAAPMPDGWSMKLDPQAAIDDRQVRDDGPGLPRHVRAAPRSTTTRRTRRATRRITRHGELPPDEEERRPRRSRRGVRPVRRRTATSTIPRKQTYFYFLVRQDGMFLINHRLAPTSTRSSIGPRARRSQVRRHAERDERPRDQRSAPTPCASS